MAITNLNQYYQSIGKSLPTLTDRSKIYQQAGLGSAATYAGTVAQNTALLAYLQKPKAPAPAPAPVAPKPVAAPAVQPPAIKPPTPTTPIPTEQLPSVQNGNQQLSQILGANINTGGINSDISGLLALLGQSTNEQKVYETKQGELTDLMKKLGEQGTDLQGELDKQGVGAAYEQVKQLNLKGAQLQGELGKFDVDTQQILSGVEGQAIPTGLIVGQQAQVQKQRDLTRLSKTSELAATVALSQAYNGNAQLGMQLAEQAINIKYQPIQAQLDVVKTQLGFAKDAMDKSDQNRATVIQTLINEKQKALDDEKDKALQIQEIAIKAAGEGAPLSIINAIKASPDAASAALAGGHYLSGEHAKVSDLATQAAANGAPANVVKAMRQAKTASEAATAGSRWLKGNLERVTTGGGGGGPTVTPPGTSSAYGAVNKGGGYFKTDSSGGHQFYDKAGNLITAAQYAANTKSNFYSALSSNAGDQKIAAAIKSVVQQINAGKIDPVQAFQDAQANPSEGGMGNIFSGITYAQFKAMLGINPPKGTTEDLTKLLHPNG